MEKMVGYTRSQGLKQQLRLLCEQCGWLTVRNLERYLLYGIIPAMQKHDAHCFSSKLQDDTLLESGTYRIPVHARLADAIGPLADQYSLSQAALVRLALWLGIEVYLELSEGSPEKGLRLAKEEFKRRACERLHERLSGRIN